MQAAGILWPFQGGCKSGHLSLCYMPLCFKVLQKIEKSKKGCNSYFLHREYFTR